MRTESCLSTPTKVLSVAFSEWFQSHPVGGVTYASAQREWRELQTARQIAIGRSPLLLRLAPVDSWQYRIARALLGRRQPTFSADTKAGVPRRDVPLSTQWQSRCTVLAMDGRGAQELNAELEQSTSPWFFPVSPHDSDEEIALVICHLLEHVADDVTDNVAVVFAGNLDSASPRGVGPHTLLSYNAVGRGALFRRSAVMDVGGYDDAAPDFEHDLVVRLSESGYNFHGAPAFHNLAPGNPPHTETTLAALRRRGHTGVVANGGDWVRWSLSSRPTVDIVIPTRDRLDLLLACLHSVESNCGEFVVRVTIVDNDSRESSTLEYFATTPHRVISHPGAFNYAAIINHGVASGNHDVVVVLNNDTVVHPGWLEDLVPIATLSDVGVVGATLVDRQGTVQHAGMGAVPYPVELPYGNIPDLFSRDTVALSRRQSEAVRNVLAVTGACHVVERAKWDRVGGMNEDLRVTANDVDLCLRMNELGWYTVLHPEVSITHVGKASRGSNESSDDHVRFLQRWGFLRGLVDPCVPVPREQLHATVRNDE